LRDTIDRVLIHDIKNMGFRLEMLRSNLDEHYGEPEFKRAVQELLAATAERLDQIVGRWSAPEDAVLIKVSLDLNGLVQEVAAAPARRGGRESRSAGNLATLSLALGDPPPIWGDPYYLRDALSSLVDNALEAAGPAGKVLVRTFRTGKGGRERAHVEVIDNGPGMSAEFVRDRFFQPFQTTKSDGVGLGVFTAGQIVRHHRGAIRVRSGPGEGTVIRVSFPVARSEP
jgi:signal transduction histidine kinase